MKRVLITGLVLLMSAIGMSAAIADGSKDSTTGIALSATTVDPDDPVGVSGLVTWMPSDNANPNASKVAKSGDVTSRIYENDDCTGAVLDDDTNSVSNGIYNNGLTAPSDEGTYGVQSWYGGTTQPPGPDLNPSTSPCRVLTVEIDGDGGLDTDPAVVCDHRAAPAVANHWMKEFQPKLKPGSPIYKNVTSLVAHGNTGGTAENDFTDWGWTVPTPPGTTPGSYSGFYPRCLEEGELDEENNILYLFPNPEFDEAVRDYTEWAFDNREAK